MNLKHNDHTRGANLPFSYNRMLKEINIIIKTVFSEGIFPFVAQQDPNFVSFPFYICETSWKKCFCLEEVCSCISQFSHFSQEAEEHFSANAQYTLCLVSMEQKHERLLVPFKTLLSPASCGRNKYYKNKHLLTVKEKENDHRWMKKEHKLNKLSRQNSFYFTS